jgi:hypothetical protein
MEQAHKYRESKGCFAPRPMVVHKIGDLHFKSCIGNFFDYSVISLMDAHDKLDKGILPFEGSYMDQPAKVMDIFKIIHNHKQEQIIAMHKEQASKMKGPQPRRTIRG